MALTRTLAPARPRTPEDDYALTGPQPSQTDGQVIDPGGMGLPAPTVGVGTSDPLQGGLPGGVGVGSSDPTANQIGDPTKALTPWGGTPEGVGVGGEDPNANQMGGGTRLIMQSSTPGLPGGVGVGVSDPLVGQSGGGLPGTGGGAPGGGQNALNTNVWDRLNQLLSSTPGYDRESPENRMQLDMQRANSARAAERSRSKLAERAAATGTLSTGGFDTGVQGIYAEQGRDDASFEADLARDSLQQQRDQISEALRIGAGLLTADQQNQLTERLAMVDAALRQQGLNLQGQLGRGDLASRLLQLLLGDRQANDRLGFDYTQLEALLNGKAFDYLLR